MKVLIWFLGLRLNNLIDIVKSTAKNLTPKPVSEPQMANLKRGVAPLMSMIFGMSLGVFAAWIVGFITVVLALLYPLMTKSEEGE